MTRPMQLDERLRPYADDRQWEIYRKVSEVGSRRKAATALQIGEASVRRALKSILRKAAQQGYAPDFGITKEVPDGLTLRGTSINYDGDGRVQQYWNKTKQQGAPVDEIIQLPDPKKIIRTATLYDNQRQVTQQWVTEKIEDVEREKLWIEAAKAMAEELPPVPPIPGPKGASDKLMACYPIGDHHNGMLAWHEETGADYDMKIAESLLYGAVDHLIAKVEPCKRSLVAFLGDFMHYDSFEPLTPAHKNLLDADSRFPKMVRSSIRMARYTIEAAARHHELVDVIWEIGNHDPSSAVFMMECLAQIYADNPRIRINTSPSFFHYIEFGKCLIGTHHGHSVKPEKLPLVMASDQAEAWGRTKHRMWWTGHVHHESKKDYNGCSVESFQVLASLDAHAANHGYRSGRSMKAIVLHREYGEVARYTFNPEMCS